MVPDAAKGLIDSFLHIGDFAYNLGEDNGRVGDQFMDMIEPLAARLPYMVSPGDHELGL